MDEREIQGRVLILEAAVDRIKRALTELEKDLELLRKVLKGDA